jgi:signal transduction histidine kinase/CheY-like chemotaxis protein
MMGRLRALRNDLPHAEGWQPLLVVLLLLLMLGEAWGSEVVLPVSGETQVLDGHAVVLRQVKELAPRRLPVGAYEPASFRSNWGLDPAATYWFSFRLRNPDDHPRSHVLFLNFPLLDHVALHEADSEGRLHPLAVAGDTVPWAERAIRTRRLALPLQLPPASTRHYVVSLRTSTPVVFPAQVQTMEAFWAGVSHAQFWQGSFYGAVALLISYSLFLYVSSRERVFFHYALATTATLLSLFCLDGFAAELIPVSALLQNLLLPLGIVLADILYLRFALNYLRIPRGSGQARATRWLTLACLGAIPLLLVLGSAYGTLAVLLLNAGAGGWMLTLGMRSLPRMRRVGSHFLAAWAVFMINAVMAVLLVLGLLPWTDLFVPALRMGLVAWAVLLLLGLGLQLRQRREAEASRREEALFVKAQTDARSKFLAMVSHELRTPMNGVLGMAELLKTTGLNTEQSRILVTMEASGQAVLEVVDDVLDHARIEAGRMELELAPLDLDTLIEDCLDLFKARIYKQQLTLLCSIDPAVPTEVVGDAERLRQVLVNLLSNAVKFTSRGSIEVRVAAVPSGQDVLLTLAVRDTGIGITPEQRESIFDSFMLVSPDNVRYRGTGLGLSISRELCQLMGGDLTVDSTPGQGSIFRAQVRVAPMSRSRSRASWPSDQPPVRLLLVEADARFNEVMVAEASTPGFTVESVESGEAAFARLLEASASGTPFGLVATALQLPDMNGLTLHGRIAREPALRGCQTLLFSLPQLQPSPGVLVHAGVAHAFERPVLARELRQAALAVVRRQPEEVAPVRVETLQYPGLRVLVAEDNRTNQVVIQGMLRRFGIQAELVENGEQAVAACRRARPTFDLILMDCEMPGMDGYEATREIRRLESEEGRTRVPIVAISAHVTQHHVDNCYAAGMDDHIPKPLNLRVLGDKLAQWAPVPAVS